MVRGTASIRIFILFHLLMIPESNQLLLPGPCPEMPPSNTSWESEGFIYVQVPFEIPRKGSHIFNGWPVEHHNCLLFAVGTAARQLPEFCIKYATTELFLRGSITSSDNGSAYKVEEMRISNYSFYSNPWYRHLSLCRMDANERMHIWSEKRFNILWSCYEEPVNRRHDEAVLVTVQYSDIHGLINLNANYSRLIKRYLGQGLRQAIKIPVRVHSTYCQESEKFVSCPVTNHLILFIIPFIAVLLLVPCICILITQKKNRVDVIT